MALETLAAALAAVRANDSEIAELTDFRRKTLALPWAAARSANGRGAIAEPIARHDPEAARAAMADHLWVLYEEIQQTATTDGRRQEVAPAPRVALT